LIFSEFADSYRTFASRLSSSHGTEAWSYGLRRFLVPVAFISSIRVVFAALLYLTLFREEGSSWIQVFANWDTGHYYLIALSWYPNFLAPRWAFFPFYPLLIRILSSVGLSIPISALIISTTCGIISIPVFQRIAEKYYTKGHALTTTLLYFLFPPVFVFLGVNYSESLFLLLTMLTWLYHLRGAEYKSLLAACFASLTRPYGVFIVFALAYDYLRKRQFGMVARLLIPILIVFGWVLYSFLETGTIAIMSATAIFWNSGNVEMIRQGLSGVMHGDFSSVRLLLFVGLHHLPLVIVSVSSVILVMILCYKAWKLDAAFAVYLITSILIIIWFDFIPGFGSFPRLLFFLFPIGLPMYTKRRWLAILVIGILIILSYVGWLAFLIDGFA